MKSTQVKGLCRASRSLLCSRGPRTRLNHLYCPSANQCTKARSNILQSCKDICERFGQADFLRVSYEPHDWPNSYVRVTVGRSDMSKFTEGSRQGSFTVNNERVVRTLKPSSEQKNALREFLQGHNLLVNLPTGFPASSKRCRCTATYSAIQPTVLESKQIRKS